MSTSPLPERPSLEFLKKLARERLHHLRRSAPQTKLADALLDVAREHGFPSWRALKAHVDQGRRDAVVGLVHACRRGESDAVLRTLNAEPDLARERDPDGSTPLHAAAEHGHLEIVQLLLRHGADPDSRDEGDHATPLHFACGRGHLEVARALLDAGADVHGDGDLHEAGIIGWATSIAPPGAIRWNVLPLLLDHGARHHIFSAMAVGDVDAIRRLVDEDPDALDRRMSRFERRQSSLHFALTCQRSDLLDLLIELGADLEARDASGRTPLEAAMMAGNHAAVRCLRSAGARLPEVDTTADFTVRMTGLADSVRKGVPMISVPDVGDALGWYQSIGFTEVSRNTFDAIVNYGMVSFGGAEIMLVPNGGPEPHDVSLWFYTDRLDDVYAAMKARQLQVAQAELDGSPVAGPRIEFLQDIEDMFYGARQFAIRDLNGYAVYFIGRAPSSSK